MKDHAYLIKAHHQFEVLKKLLMLLDDERNDIYLHIGKGVEYNQSELKEVVLKSGLFFVEKVKEEWGGYSQIRSELYLFEAAYKRGYTYYHLLSGSDLPLKTQDEIHDFFEKYQGKEFLYFCPPSFWKESVYKYEQYHWLQEKVGRKSSGCWYFLEKVSLFLQRKLGVKRRYGNMEMCLGANWCSITHELTGYILENRELIYKMFHDTLCCDEFYKQTLVWNSRFKESVFSYEDNYIACLRFIDWKRGNPYVWKLEDYEELISSEHLFARKFEETVDKDIIEKVFEYISNM